MGILTAIDPTGNTIGQPRAVAPGESVAAAETQRLRLTIRDRHTITIDPGTRLTANRTGDGGCTIALSTGQITASVRRAEGEGVFRVTTPHAELIVTGTVFTVGATLDNTRLSVREGTVQLARPDRPAITVAAGQEYSTHGDVLVRLDGDERLLALADELKDPVAAAMRSPWYKERFSPLLHLRDYLVSRGVEADELTLLAISAEPWCLQYPKDADAGHPPFVHRLAGLQRAARFFGFTVEAIRPAGDAEALGLAQRALGNGDLVLAYGRGAKAVQALDGAAVAEWGPETEWRYRFLGQDRPVDFAMARVSAFGGRSVDRLELAREAVADIPKLLAATDDAGYFVGRLAVRQWADDCARADRMRADDAPLKDLAVLANLAVACRWRHASLGVGGEAAPWRAFAAEIRRALEGAFSSRPGPLRDLERRERPHPTEGLAEALDRALAAHRPGLTREGR